VADSTAPLADLIDAQGHRVLALPAPSGLLAILSHAPDGQLCSGGHPCLNRENAVELRDALNEFIERYGP